jgi:heme/copper-type cytochrome/quinol oxidase subunit 2
VEDPLRLLRVTGSLVLPSHAVVRIMATAEDVTHSWAVPGLGIKLDCVPGRLFVTFISVIRNGVYYGQCSELCGWNHYNMPINIYAIPLEQFLAWWELELHLVFSAEDNSLGHNYALLNFKYK